VRWRLGSRRCIMIVDLDQRNNSCLPSSEEKFRSSVTVKLGSRGGSRKEHR
jgi:hypothetical protein